MTQDSSERVQNRGRSTIARDEFVYRRYLDFQSLVTGGRVVPNWLPDGSSFWFMHGDATERQILKVDPASNVVSALFDVPRLRSSLRDRLGYEPAGRGVPFDRMIFRTPCAVVFWVDSARFELDLSCYSLTRLPNPSTVASEVPVPSEVERTTTRTFARWKFYGTGQADLSPEAMSPTGEWIAGIEKHDLVLRATVDGQCVRITHDGTPETFWDIETSLWNPWSADGRHLAVFRQHTAGMVRIPNIEWLKPREQVREFFALPAGGTMNRSELFLLDLCSLRLERVDLGDTTDRHLQFLSWWPDSSALVFASYNRALSKVDLLRIDLTSCAVSTLLTEECSTFLAHYQHVLLTPQRVFTPMPDASGFIWASERDGWNHLYRYDMQGGLLARLTQGDWRVSEVVHIDPGTRWVYFMANCDRKRPYDVHLCRVGLDGGDFVQLTEGKGQHAIYMSPSGKWFTDTYSAVDIPPRTVLRAADGSLIRQLAEADVRKLHAVGWVAPQEHVVKAADETTDLWATLYLPYRFDPREKYPVIEYIYGGPQLHVRPSDFGDVPSEPALARQEYFNRALAHLGFVVVTLDARGTPGRSKAFQDTVFRNWGQFEITDHVAALQELGRKLKFLDLERVGVWGHSWGGQFAFRALAQAPELYRVGISCSPALDPRRMRLYEPYLGSPLENPEAYLAADPFTLVSHLQGEILLIGGMNDPATQGDLFRLSELLIRRGKQHRMMSYPCCGHVPVGQTAEYDMELKKRYFMEHLSVGNAVAERVSSSVPVQVRY